MHLFFKSLLITILGAVLLFSCSDFNDQQVIIEDYSHLESKELTLMINHPGFKEPGPQEFPVDVLLNKDGEPVIYKTQVHSVFCSDDRCDVITLEMRWDFMGRFKSYKLKEKDKLTKYDHKPFTAEDYKKFNVLMKARGSILGSTEKADLITPDKKQKKKEGITSKEKLPEVKSEQRVDAVSGATSDFIKDEVVEGAAYTCFTMWHWANGEISTNVRKNSQKLISESNIKTLLNSKDPQELLFAYECISSQKSGTDLIKKAVQSSIEANEECFDFFLNKIIAGMSEKEQLPVIQKILPKTNQNNRLRLLNFLESFDGTPSSEFYEEVTDKRISEMNFHELNLLLGLLEKHKVSSEIIYADLSGLLDGKNFFIARRVYEFLESKSMNEELTKKVSEFKIKHKSRLR